VAPSPDERVTVALVRGLHGLRGAVRLEVLTDTPGRFRLGSVLYVEGQDAPLTVDWTGPSKPGLLVHFAEVTSREAAEPLRERYLEVVPEAKLPAGSWYWHEIVGLEAHTTSGEVLGTVSEVFRAGAGEVYVVTGGLRGEVLVPAVRGIVTELVPAEGRLVVDPLALDLPAPRAREEDLNHLEPVRDPDQAPAPEPDPEPVRDPDQAPAPAPDPEPVLADPELDPADPAPAPAG
jgi:16S rRNA processing protein RimM